MQCALYFRSRLVSSNPGFLEARSGIRPFLMLGLQVCSMHSESKELGREGKNWILRMEELLLVFGKSV